MARTVLEQAFPPDWIDDVFETHRRCQYVRELLFSTVVELMTLVVLGLRPSLHAAARRSDLPVSLTTLHDKINLTEPEVLRALVQASAARLAPAMAGLGPTAILPGWQVRVLDGNHLLGTEKRAARLCRAKPWWSTIPTAASCSTWWRARTPIRPSASWRAPC